MNRYRYLAIDPRPQGLIISLLSHVLKVDLLRELRTALDDAVHGVVITGRDGFFAAGADIQELSRLSGPEALNYARLGQDVLNRLADGRLQTVAAIDGFCMGGALDLSLACSFRFATAKSILAHPGGRIGIMTGWGGTRRLPLTIGKARALEMMTTGRRLSAAEALSWGLIHGVVQDPVKHGLAICGGAPALQSVLTEGL